ncbi:hypothetical protein GCM10009655_14890 [Rhodoglobus aureus]|uniref:Uncharacterized protein n=2 Tax=Rhodoglobus aureus TaxID=191497 RepID=A0ABN1VPM0_9MICO
MVAYLGDYAHSLDADIRYGQTVDTLDRDNDGFTARGSGFTIEATHLIMATGSFDSPYIPPLPRAHEFSGQILHSADYVSPHHFAGTQVAVVGAGNSAVQIATELSAVADVTVCSRRPVHWQAQRLWGRDNNWWLSRSGLDTSKFFAQRLGAGVPVIDDGTYQRAFREGRVQWRPLFDRVDTAGVHHADGSVSTPDTIIFATGYRPHLPLLTSILPHVEATTPSHRNGVSTVDPQLGFVGSERQRSFSSATVRGVGADALATVRGLKLMEKPSARSRYYAH